VTSRKTLLLLGGGTYFVRAIEAVRDAGYRTIVIDRDPAAPGLAVADVGRAIDVVDTPAVLALARDECIDGVLPQNEFGVPTAAHVASALGLRGLTPRSAELACDKGLMREQWERDGLANAEFRVVVSERETREACAAIGLPVVLKPADSGGGGRGVSVVREPDDLAWAYEFAGSRARNGRIVVERFVEGTELTIESISYDGDVHVLAVSDKVKPPRRTRVATSLTYPADLSPGALEQVHALASAAVRSLGITDGPSHVEMILTDAGPVLLELGARGGGGHVFSVITEAVSGVPMVAESARVLVGDEPDLRIRHERGCVYLLFSPERGVIRAVHGVDEARALPGVLELGITRRPGDVLGPLVDSLQRSGFAVVAGRTRQEAMRRADAVFKTVQFELDPLPGNFASPCLNQQPT
jgi:biotin carboxylase